VFRAALFKGGRRAPPRGDSFSRLGRGDIIYYARGALLLEKKSSFGEEFFSGGRENISLPFL